VRRIIKLALVPVALAAFACKGDKRAPTAMADDLKRDLQLASSTQNLKLSPDEISPKSQQELALRTKKAPNGPRVVGSDRPTPRASATPTDVAEIKTDIPQVQVLAASPAPSETPSAEPPPLARPSAMPTPMYPAASPIPANSGSGGILGGIFGAVIRGGGVGDDDHCDPRGGMPRRPQSGRPVGGDIMGLPGTAGMGGTRIPVVMGGRRR
jgi:hypothetical protein